MPFNVNFELMGESQVVRKLADYQERADNLLEHPDVISSLRNVFFKAEREQFGSEGAHGSGGWAPLAASTIRSKASRGLDPRILHATNRLLRSLLAPGPDAQLDVSSDSVFMGTSVDYAIYHQRGGRLHGNTASFAKQRAVSRDALARGTISRDQHESKLRSLRGQHGLPQRKPVELSEGDRRDMVRVIQAALVPSRRKRYDFNPS